MRLLSLIFAVTIISISSVSASEYCLDRYSSRITAVNAELGGDLTRLNVLQDQLRQISSDKDNASKTMVAIIKSDPTLKDPADQQKMSALSAQFDTLDRQETSAKNEFFGLQDRVVALKGTIPADLQGELRGCIEAVKPANTLVNTVIQALAILTTGGASLALPPKALYVDMGQVLNGYPFGGDQSLVNKARNDVLNALGIGGANNDLGKIIKDPGRVVRCIFGC